MSIFFFLKCRKVWSLNIQIYRNYQFWAEHTHFGLTILFISKNTLGLYSFSSLVRRFSRKSPALSFSQHQLWNESLIVNNYCWNHSKVMSSGGIEKIVNILIMCLIKYFFISTVILPGPVKVCDVCVCSILLIWIIWISHQFYSNCSKTIGNIKNYCSNN